MRQAVMTLIGLYNWDSSLFDGLLLPPDIVKDDFVDELLSMAGSQNLLYTDFDLMKRLIRTWSSRRIAAWGRIQGALNAEYNPIHNYDRTESYTDTRDLHDTNTDTRDLKNSNTDTRNLTGSQNTSGSETVAAYDASTLQPRSGQTGNSSYTDGGTISSSGAQTGTVTSAGSQTGTITHEAHLYGNIGVTTSEQMITEELELRKTDLTAIIISEFIARFCLDVYN